TLGGKGPTYLVHLSEEDPAFPKCLNGRFHKLLVNKSDATTTLFNDRYGMHRIYYHQSADSFYFAAEAKAILKVVPKLREADPQSLEKFVAYNYILKNRTLFRNVEVLPTASA